MPHQHKSLASGRWSEFSLSEQLGNIGSEVSRALKWRDKDKALYDGAAVRALELFDLTLADLRWRKRLKEIARARELFCDTVFGEKEFGTNLEDIDRYFFYFALAARQKKNHKTS